MCVKNNLMAFFPLGRVQCTQIEVSVSIPTIYLKKWQRKFKKKNSNRKTFSINDMIDAAIIQKQWTEGHVCGLRQGL